ncbi:hypothetical protein GC174_18235 [bacterium]|nr:hypothetical protein [bacterium]
MKTKTATTLNAPPVQREPLKTYSTSPSSLWDYIQCPGRVRLRRWDKEEKHRLSTLKQEIGRVVHDLVPLDERNRQDRLDSLHYDISADILPQAERVVSESETLLARSDRIIAYLKKYKSAWEETFDFLDSVTGFRIYAQPELVMRPRFGEVTVFDLKTTASKGKYVSQRDGFKMKLFGWVILNALKQERDIDYRVNLSLLYLKDEKLIETPYSEADLDSFMNAEVRPKLRKLRRSIETREFMLRPGGHCKHCQMRSICPLAKYELERSGEINSSPD